MRLTVVRSLILAASMLAMFAPASAAAPQADRVTVNAEVTVEATSLDCDFRGEPDCLNLMTRVDWNQTTRTGTFCVDVGDFSGLDPVVAHGCATLAADSVAVDEHRRITVSETVVAAVFTEDCYNTDPEEHCIPRNIDLHASLKASSRAPSRLTKIQTMTKSGGCRTVVRQRTLAGNADVVLTVEGNVYRLPDATAVPHTASSALTFSSTRTTQHC